MIRFHPRRLALALAVTVVVLLAGPASSASAHATLESTTPSQGSQVGQAPTLVTLHFSESVGLNDRSIQVLDPQGHRVDTGTVHHASGDAATVEVGLAPNLPRASYAVVWHVVSADSHPVSGTFSFGVGVPAGAAPLDAGTDRVVSVADGVFRFIADTAAVLLIGPVFFVLVLWPSGVSRARLRRLVVAGWGLSVVTTVGLFVLEGPFGAGLGLGAVTEPGLMSATLSTGYGKLLLLRLVALGLIVPAARRLDRAGDALARSDAASIGVLIIASFSLAGHAGQGSWVVLAATLDAAHLAAACVWLGGLAVLAVSLDVEGLGAEGLGDALPRWSRVAMIAVATLAVTGTYQAWRNVGSVPALTGTDYGQTLLLKVIGVLLLVAVGDQSRRWVNRRVCVAHGIPHDASGHAPAALHTASSSSALNSAPTPSPSSPAAGRALSEPGTSVAAPSRSADPGPAAPTGGPAIATLRRGVIAELVIGLAVLAFTSALVGGVPGRVAYTPPYSATLTGWGNDGTTISVLVDIPSTKVGPQTMHLYTYTKAGEVLPFQSATATLTEHSKALGPIKMTFFGTGIGHGTAEGIALPAPGQWTLTIQVHTDATTDFAATTKYDVR